jgi:hypothetical protein
MEQARIIVVDVRGPAGDGPRDGVGPPLNRTEPATDAHQAGVCRRCVAQFVVG